MRALDITLQHDHPTPLYHQIATAIRWKIGTGVLVPGELLPPLRSAAEAWNVSYHTVRRAYSELARLGLVRSTRGDGTRVLAATASSPPSDQVGPEVEAFLQEIVGRARDHHGLTSAALARLLRERADFERPTDGPHDELHDRGAPPVFVVECNNFQARDLAEQLAVRWPVHAVPWHLLRQGEPPEGLILGTRFHQGEMLQRWPHRAGDMVFVALRLDDAVPDRLARAVAEGARLVLVERDVGTAHQHAADLARATPGRIEVEATTELPTLERLERSSAFMAIAPRLSDSLDAAVLEHPRVMVLRHTIEERDLERIGPTIERHLQGQAVDEPV